MHTAFSTDLLHITDIGNGFFFLSIDRDIVTLKMKTKTNIFGFMRGCCEFIYPEIGQFFFDGFSQLEWFWSHHIMRNESSFRGSLNIIVNKIHKYFIFWFIWSNKWDRKLALQNRYCTMDKSLIFFHQEFDAFFPYLPGIFRRNCFWWEPSSIYWMHKMNYLISIFRHIQNNKCNFQENQTVSKQLRPSEHFN